MDEEKIEELLGAMLALSGAGMAMERVLYAIMSAHPERERLHQLLSAELHPTKAPHTLQGPLLDEWHATAARFLEHSVTLLSLSQSGQAVKN